MDHQHLYTIDADTLMSTSLPPLRFVIDRLLPQGVNVLAGSSKIGKSWLALWLCLQVAKGESVWGLATHGGTVLYLCLEDNFTRIQNRLFQITDDAPETLHFATIAAGLYSGLQEQLTNFLAQHPDTSLVVIDTFQRIRDGNDTGPPYASDYRDVTALKAIADKHSISLLLVHHTRKQQADDPMDKISGTTGISGAADNNFVLEAHKRGCSEATLACMGRDIEHMELSLGSFEGTATELSERLEAQTGEKLTPSVLSKRLVKYAAVLEQEGVRVVSTRTRTARSLSILCLPRDGSDGSDGKK